MQLMSDTQYTHSIILESLSRTLFKSRQSTHLLIWPAISDSNCMTRTATASEVTISCGIEMHVLLSDISVNRKWNLK